MKSEISAALTQLTRLLPAAMRGVLAGATIVSGAIVAVLRLGEPTIRPALDKYVTLYPPSQTDWFFVSVPVAYFVWNWRRRSNPTNAAAYEVMKTIDLIAAALNKSRATKLVQATVWREIVKTLAAEARVGGKALSKDRLVEITVEQAPDLRNRL